MADIETKNLFRRGEIMRFWVIKKELEWLEEMQSEARTKEILISSCRRFNDNREIEIHVSER